MIAALLIALIACAALAYAAAPLKGGPRREEPDPSQLLEDAESRKLAALTAIVDIENERDIGKLSEPDFNELRRYYEVQALAALAELDSLRTDDPVEEEIAAMKARLTCPSCGALRRVNQACPRCGD